jgi:hypothetical protein
MGGVLRSQVADVWSMFMVQMLLKPSHELALILFGTSGVLPYEGRAVSMVCNA